MKFTFALLVICAVVAVHNIAANEQRRRNRPLSLQTKDIEVTQLPTGTKLYKTIGNPFYEPSRNLLIEMPRPRLNDWQGHYFAVDRDVARGYVSDYTNGRYGKAYLHTFELREPINVVRVKKTTFGGDGDAEEKARSIKEFLRDHPGVLNSGIVFNENEHLVPELNRRGYAIEMPHDTDGHTELIIGDTVASKLRKTMTTIVVFDGVDLTEYQNENEIPQTIKNKIKASNPDSVVGVQSNFGERPARGRA